MKRWIATLASALALGACDFERASDDEALAASNSCTIDADCGAGSMCVNHLCVAPSADDELQVVLQVTPLPTANSAPPLPVLTEPLTIKQGPLTRRVDLALPVTVSGSIRLGEKALDAALNFTSMGVPKGISLAPVAVSTTAATNGEASDYLVQLSAGVSYSLLVRPADASLPPYRTTFTAEQDLDVSVDYEQLETHSQTFLLKAPADRRVTVRAFDLMRDEPISSTALVENGRATLVFASEPVPYRLEIRAEQSYEPSAGGKAEGIFCDDQTPVYPIYSIAEADLSPKDRDGAIEIDLPDAPPRIRYQGTVALCDEGAKDSAAVGELPVTLHSTELMLPEGSKFTARFEAKTTAQIDPSSQSTDLSFCVQLMEGEYDVVVTPPTTSPCAIYAEHRLIDSPDGMAAAGVLLMVPRSASLRAPVLTGEAMPLAGATVEAVALGRATKIDVVDDVMTLTRYNRSRQAVTGENGVFNLEVDLGSYDLLIKPPASSGFSWQVRHDLLVGARREFASVVDMSAPIMLSGRLAYPGSDEAEEKLAGAEVLAFAIIPERPAEGGDVPGTRAVAIGKTMAAPDATFTLLLPQALPEW